MHRIWVVLYYKFGKESFVSYSRPTRQSARILARIYRNKGFRTRIAYITGDTEGDLYITPESYR